MGGSIEFETNSLIPEELNLAPPPQNKISPKDFWAVPSSDQLQLTTPILRLARFYSGYWLAAILQSAYLVSKIS